jgi:hypothetical protein
MLSYTLYINGMISRDYLFLIINHNYVTIRMPNIDTAAF